MWPALIFIILGWLVFNWVPGYWHARHFEKLNPRMEEIIRKYGQGGND